MVQAASQQHQPMVSNFDAVAALKSVPSSSAAVVALADSGDWEQAIALLPDLEAASGSPPDSTVFDPILRACARAGAWSGALDLLCSLTQRGVSRARLFFFCANPTRALDVSRPCYMPSSRSPATQRLLPP